jgi:hypothetical protein
MDMLPDHACDGHGAHKTHYDDALAFHKKENAQRAMSNTQL